MGVDEIDINPWNPKRERERERESERIVEE
jgi:hypothetical protein